MIYATCSLVTAENEQAIEAFLARNGEFQLLPVAGIWAEILPGDCPVDGPYLRLTPARHSTDGFFAAILERAGTAAATPAPSKKRKKKSRQKAAALEVPPPEATAA